MLVTLLGMVIEDTPVQPEKAELPIAVTSSPIITSCIAVFPLNQLPISLQFNVTEVSPLQPENASRVTLVTLLGMVTEVM